MNKQNRNNCYNLARLIQWAKQHEVIYADSALSDLALLLDRQLKFISEVSSYGTTYLIVDAETGKNPLVCESLEDLLGEC